MASAGSDHVPQHNNGVDYVIRYRFGEGMNMGVLVGEE